MLVFNLFVADRRMNEALVRLRHRVPDSFIRYRAGCSANGQVSKLETLRGAARYMRHLNSLITQHDLLQQQQQQFQEYK